MNRKAWSLPIVAIVLMSGIWPPGSAAADGRGGFGVMNQVRSRKPLPTASCSTNKDS
jgi:hypothetical protein